MRHLKFAAIAFAILAIPICAPAEAVAQTAGPPQADFIGVQPATLSSQLAMECMNGGFVVTEQSPQMVACQRQLSGWNAAITMFAISNMHSTPPVQTVRFAIAELEPGRLRVQGSAMVQSMMPLGQVRSMPMDGPGDVAVIQGVLTKLGGR